MTTESDTYFKEVTYSAAPSDYIEYKALLNEGGDDTEKKMSVKQQIVLGLMVLIAIFLTLFLGFYVQALKSKSHVVSMAYKCPVAGHAEAAAVASQSHVKLLCKCILLRHSRVSTSHLPLRTMFKLTLTGNSMSELHKRCNSECQKMKQDMIDSDRELTRQDKLKLNEIEHQKVDLAKREKKRHAIADQFWISHRSILVPIFIKAQDPRPFKLQQRKHPLASGSLTATKTELHSSTRMDAQPSRPIQILPEHLAPFTHVASHH